MPVENIDRPSKNYLADYESVPFDLIYHFVDCSSPIFPYAMDLDYPEDAGSVGPYKSSQDVLHQTEEHSPCPFWQGDYMLLLLEMDLIEKAESSRLSPRFVSGLLTGTIWHSPQKGDQETQISGPAAQL